MKLTDENLRLMNEAVRKQLEDAGVNIMDLVPDANELLKRIKEEEARKNIPDEV